MESTIAILIIIIISYFISKYFTKYFQSNSTIFQILFGITSFFVISYIYTCLQKSGPQRAIFMDSILILTMLPLLPFVLLYRYIFDQ